jgi:xanthine dehydrogenase/oxidase
VPLPPNTLHAAFVTSSRPHAKLVSVDASAAVAMPGVAGYFGAADVPGSNWIGPIMRDEEVFATDTVTCVGQVGCLISGMAWAACFCVGCCCVLIL